MEGSCKSEEMVRIPPNELDAEGVLLSYAFLYGAKDFDKLEPRHFYADANRLIFAAIRELEEGEKPVDPVAVARLLLSRGTENGTNLARVGGTPYLARLQDAIPASSRPNVQAHAAAIVEAWKCRVLILAFAEAVAKLYSREFTSAEAWDHVKEAVRAQREV